MVQPVKYPALSLQQLRSLLWHGSILGPEISTCPRHGKKKKKKNHRRNKMTKNSIIIANKIIKYSGTKSIKGASEVMLS